MSGRAVQTTPATVLLLADYGGPYAGSFIPAIRAIAKSARARGLRIECGFTEIARDRPWLTDLEQDGIPVHFAPGWDRRALRNWIHTRVAAIGGDIVLHTHFTAFDLPAAAVARARDDLMVLWHVHSFLPRGPHRWLTSSIKYGWIARAVSRIICAGSGPAEAIGRRGQARKTVIVPNGIDTDRFAPIDSAERLVARKSLGLSLEEPVLLHFSWNWRIKGGPLFSECLARVREQAPNVVGLSVGGGEQASEAAHALGLSEALRGLDPDEDVRRFYAAADALVATSDAEGGAPTFAILEALSCGLPVVATDIPGHRVEVEKPAALRNGPAVADRLACLIADVLALDPDQRAAEGAEASRWVARHRDLASSAERIVELYAASLDDRQRRE